MTKTTDAQLIMTEGPQEGKAFALRDPPLILGRDPRNALVMDHPEVSRRHARLTRRAGQWVIEDLESTNGTSVNGTPLDGARRLCEDDTIALGSAIALILKAARQADDDSPSRPTSHDGPPPRPAQPGATYVGRPGRAEQRAESIGPAARPVSPSAQSPVRQPRSDLAWIWLLAAFVALLVIAASAAAVIISYLGLLPIPL